jgi:hypothetical protein
MKHAFNIRFFTDTCWLTISLVTAMVSQPSWAQVMRPYKAIYSIEWQVGINLSGQAERSLRQDEQGYWQLRTEASAMLASITEISHFDLQQQLVPLEYFYQSQILHKTRRAHLTFDWQQGEVLNNVNDQPWRMQIVPGTYDKQSVQLQLRRDLMAKQPNLSYTVADGGRLKVFAYKVEAEEVLETLLGKIHTIRVKRDRGADSNRNTWIWFAPQHNFMIVRLEQHEADDKRYQLNLQQLTWLD